MGLQVWGEALNCFWSKFSVRMLSPSLDSVRGRKLEETGTATRSPHPHPSPQGKDMLLVTLRTISLHPEMPHFLLGPKLHKMLEMAAGQRKCVWKPSRVHSFLPCLLSTNCVHQELTVHSTDLQKVLE